MKSIVVSASEFMIDKTKLIDASRIAPVVRHRSMSSATPAMVLWPSARVSGVISSETVNCARARLLSGSEMTQCIQFDQAEKKLLAKRSLSWKLCQRSRSHIGFQFEVKLVEQSFLVSK